MKRLFAVMGASFFKEALGVKARSGNAMDIMTRKHMVKRVSGIIANVHLYVKPEADISLLESGPSLLGIRVLALGSLMGPKYPMKLL